MNKQTRENSTIREDILETLDQIYPNNMIEMWQGFEVSYLEDIYDDLQTKLSEIETAAIEYERDWTGDDFGCEECEGCPECLEMEKAGNIDIDNEDEEASLVGEEEETKLIESPGEDNPASSYHLFFLALQGDEFEYDCQAEDIDEEGNTISLKGTGVIGCCVGVSLLAPFAVVTPASMEIYEDDSYTYPDIDLHYVGLTKTANHLADFVEANFTGLMEQKDIQALNDLMNRVIPILESFDISILPPGEANKPVPWLKPGDDVFIEVPEDENITLKEALFYRGIF